MTIVNITCGTDADFHRTFQYVYYTTTLPVDITGCALEMMLRRHAADMAALLRLGTDTGEITLTDPVNGLFTVFIAQASLERLGPDDYDHSMIMTPAGSSNKVRIWSGTLTNNAGPTR